MVMIFGEITTKAKLNYEQVVREAIKKIGYDDEKKGLNYAVRMAQGGFIIFVCIFFKLLLFAY